MPIEYQQWITRADLRANPDKLYVFGDNFARTGFGGQAKEMRGEPNAVGIPTKINPQQFLTDEWFYGCLTTWQQEFDTLAEHVVSGGTVVFPSDGIGTGLADLRMQAPLCWELLQLFQKYLKMVSSKYENSK